jgi:hypothetical protein
MFHSEQGTDKQLGLGFSKALVRNNEMTTKWNSSLGLFYGTVPESFRRASRKQQQQLGLPVF